MKCHSCLSVAALVLCTALFLSGCSGASLAGDPAAGETVTAAVPEAKPAFQIPAVARPLTPEDVAAIPVARPGMTEDELRAICVRYMVMMKSVRWTPDANIRYDNPPAVLDHADGTITLPAGVVYAGLPYTSASSDLLCFLDHYDCKTGVLSVSRMGRNLGDLIGNACTSCAFWAWARVSTKLYMINLSYMNELGGCKVLGPMVYDHSSRFEDTPSLLRENGEQIMYQCYALAKPATGIVRYPRGTYGHVGMSVTTASVVYRDDGTIDGEKSTLIMADQTPTVRKVADESGEVHYIGYNGRTITFRQLYDEGYLVFEIPEFAGLAEVEEARVELALPDGDPERLFEGTVTSNYGISRVDALLLDENGGERELGHALAYCFEKRARNIPVSEVIGRSALSRIVPKGESCRVAFRVRLGNGETYTLDPVTVTP